MEKFFFLFRKIVENAKVAEKVRGKLFRKFFQDNEIEINCFLEIKTLTLFCRNQIIAFQILLSFKHFWF